jgi:allose kinase
MREFVLGIDIGGTNIRIGAVAMDGSVAHLEKRSSRVVCDGGDSVELLIAFIRDFAGRWGYEGRFHAITAGFPSPVSKDRRVVYSCPNLQNETGGFDGRDVVTPLEAAFGVPVFIAKDSVFLLQYALKTHALEGTTIGIYYGTGIGNMVYLNGQFLSGKHNVACDLGHMPFYLSDRYCTCGNRGCVESYAAGHVLRDIWQNNFRDTPFEELFARHADHELLRNFVEAMAIPVATEVNIFDPDNVVLGGGVLEMRGFPLERMKEIVRGFTRKPFPDNDFTYIRASNAVDIGVIGGAYYAMDRLNLG